MKTEILSKQRKSQDHVDPSSGLRATMPDFYVLGGGTLYLLQPNTDAARDWIREHISDEAQTLGESVAVEHRYLRDILEGIRDDGLTFENN